MKKNRGRNVHGILLLDKPVGVTSNQALQLVKRLYQARKAGHTGSLDKPASGMLPLCLGEATKWSAYLLDADKNYQVVCKLGIATATGDAAGEVIATSPVPSLMPAAVEQVLDRYRGQIRQTPPMYSALKHGGQRLYNLAYAGITVERASRTVVIHELSLESFTGDELALRVRCSKGTYIRALAADIGQELGCGAHVSYLRRTGVGRFRADQMVTVDQLKQLSAAGDSAALDAKLLPMDSILEDMPAVHLNETMAYYLLQGQAITVAHAPSQGLVRLYDHRDRFLGVGAVLDDGRVTPKRLVQTE